MSMLRGLLVLLALASPLDAAPQDISLGARHYLIDLPDHPTGAMILVLHGGGGNPAQFAEMTEFSVPALAQGYAVIYPAATQPKNLTMWNGGAASKNRPDDIGFLDQVITDASQRFSLNPSRVYLTGMSNGAMMAEAYAMQRAGAVKAVAGVSGTIDLKRTPVNPVPMLIIHGTADQRVPYDGGRGAKTKVKNANFAAIPDQVAAIVTAFGTLTKTDTVIDPASDGMRVLQSDYSNAAGVQVRLLQIEGGGHVWPGLPRKNSNKDISANTEVLRFFAAHP
ncbi:MAG: hypothetical protein JWS10_3467 [Cypionkella sp.]|uniref:alpha/beta hydrolase family esterase n=1 Tax=Cypionkella sp. TaxID=2811411 RepID=UPI0026223460|nr:PHB depolymerase family esterase [Cypionkella sp.]MDB5660852.1 hypothetical protein [Cypionkella sp.]